MNQAALEEQITKWEPVGCEVIRTIDAYDDTVERIIKVVNSYYLYRYFTLGGNDHNIFVSVDLQAVDADHIIQHLAERL